VTYDLLRTTDLGRNWLDVLRSGSFVHVNRPKVPVPPGGPTPGPAAAGAWSIPGALAVPSATSAWYTIVNEQDGAIGFGATGDAGLSWHSRWFPAARTSQQPAPTSTRFPPVALWLATTALDARHAWSLFTGTKNAGVSDLYATSDGGATWHRVATFGLVGR